MASAQVDDGPCVMHIGPGGSGNFVKMVHNGIEYGDMQLISEAYDVLRTVGGLTNDELAETFTLWNKACPVLLPEALNVLANNSQRWCLMSSDRILNCLI